MGHQSPHLGVLGAHFYHFLGHIPQALQRAGRTRANFRVSDLAVVLRFIAFALNTPNGLWPLGRTSCAITQAKGRGIGSF
jgi:hypothetical protein